MGSTRSRSGFPDFYDGTRILLVARALHELGAFVESETATFDGGAALSVRAWPLGDGLVWWSGEFGTHHGATTLPCGYLASRGQVVELPEEVEGAPGVTVGTAQRELSFAERGLELARKWAWDERYGGAGLIQGDVDDFNSFIHDCSLAELRAMGHFFTWSNSSRRGIHKLRRLDRCLVNEDWLCTYPLSTATLKNSGLSDHSPIIIQIEGQEISKPKPFRFHNMWLDDASLFEVVERAWAVEIKGNPMFQFVKKLKEVKSRIKSWNYNVFGRIDVLLPIARQELKSIQSQIAANPTDPNLRNVEAVIKEKVIQTANLEEALYRQKARINWLNSGDCNSAFFHSAMKARRNLNCIMGFTLPDGNLTSNPDRISETLVSYYQHLLNSQNTNSHPINIPNPISKLSPEQASLLSRKISKDEIEYVVKSRDGDKAPGPDGFNGKFF
ncbi:uncharacterized protein LOC143888611 [Tasmannia lanceolata]|uniref:uncharacterized protein LOC143888611 n=1 Tax=Tasmannia lanceolata TaxID=3420 RepID=UPI004063943D